MRLAALPLLLALVLALAACGGDGDEASPTTAGSTTSGTTTTPAFEEPDPLPRTPVEGGYLYEVSEEGFEVAVPRAWIARSAGQVPDPRTLRRLSTEYPTVIGYFEALVGDTPTRFVAVSPRLRDNFAENLTITVEDLEPGTTLQAYGERTLGQIQATAANVKGEVRTGNGRIPAGGTREIAYERNFSNEIVIATRHYLLVEGNQGWALTFSTSAPDDGFEQATERALDSFRFLES